ncbi:MAG: hypothetical protein Q8L27_03430 [archaeon]|nr:hypothetical protein [archaeon]
MTNYDNEDKEYMRQIGICLSEAFKRNSKRIEIVPESQAVRIFYDQEEDTKIERCTRSGYPNFYEQLEELAQLNNDEKIDISIKGQEPENPESPRFRRYTIEVLSPDGPFGRLELIITPESEIKRFIDFKQDTDNHSVNTN